MKIKLPSRRRLARLWDLAVVNAGLVVLYLGTDPQAKAWLADHGGYATMIIGALCFILNRQPAHKAPAE